MSNIAKKKNKEDGIYFCGKNADDVTGSCILIKYTGKQILLECGMFQSNDYLESYKVNSKKFQFNPSDIDYVFIAHVHQDHMGLLPRLVKEGFRGKIITTHVTAELMKPMLLNSTYILQSEANILSNKYKRKYLPLYGEEDVMKVFDCVYEYDETNEIFILDDIVSFQWFDNSHCIGARQLQLILTDSNGNKNSILYTSDIGALNTENHYLQNTIIPESYNKISIMESTYGDASRENKKTRKFDLEHLKSAIDTVLERGGTVIMPCFSFSRTQEILTIIYEMYHNDPSFIYDVVIDSMLSCQITNLYNFLLDSIDLEKWKKVKYWDNVVLITEKDESIACVKNHKPKIVISSSGFCTNGRILSYLHEYLPDEKSMVIFSGYTGSDNSYLSYRIKNYKENKLVKISGDPVENKADCINLYTFSSHANRKDLIKYGSSLNTEKLVLVHGSSDAKNSLKESLKEAISKNDKTYKVVCSSEGMVIHL